jgi:hypothetical protein
LPPLQALFFIFGRRAAAKRRKAAGRRLKAEKDRL